jgi:uncharacterized damage-inducible protein DinB
MSLLLKLFNYKKWADERAIRAAHEIDIKRFPKEEKFIRQQLNHLVLVEENFKARLLCEIEPNQTNNTEVIPPLNAIASRINISNAWYEDYVVKIRDDDLNKEVSFVFVDKLLGRMTRYEILFHIINHSTYHRGAIGRELDIAGALRPADTYTAFIHIAEPQRRNHSN